MDDANFEGSGTPISSLIQQPQQPQYIQQQQQQYNQQPQQQQYIQQQPQQRINYGSNAHNNDYSGSAKSGNDYKVRFESMTGCRLVVFVTMFIMIIIMNNSMVLGFEKNLLPVILRFGGDPPLFVVILNAIVVSIVFLLVCKYT